MSFKGREVVSQSLLDSVKFPPSPAFKRIKKYFDLGMAEFGYPWSDHGETDSDEYAFQPTKKKRKVKAVAKPKDYSTSRFGTPTISDQLQQLPKGVVPKNTQKNDAWALTTFVDWIHASNSSCPDYLCPQGVLLTYNASLLDKWLSFHY